MPCYCRYRSAPLPYHLWLVLPLSHGARTSSCLYHSNMNLSVLLQTCCVTCTITLQPPVAALSWLQRLSGSLQESCRWLGNLATGFLPPGSAPNIPRCGSHPCRRLQSTRPQSLICLSHVSDVGRGGAPTPPSFHEYSSPRHDPLLSLGCLSSGDSPVAGLNSQDHWVPRMLYAPR